MIKYSDSWCLSDKEMKALLGDQYQELINSGDIDRADSYNVGYTWSHFSINFSEKAKKILKERFLE